MMDEDELNMIGRLYVAPTAAKALRKIYGKVPSMQFSPSFGGMLITIHVGSPMRITSLHYTTFVTITESKIHIKIKTMQPQPPGAPLATALPFHSWQIDEMTVNWADPKSKDRMERFFNEWYTVLKRVYWGTNQSDIYKKFRAIHGYARGGENG